MVCTSSAWLCGSPTISFLRYLRINSIAAVTALCMVCNCVSKHVVLLPRDNIRSWFHMIAGDWTIEKLIYIR